MVINILLLVFSVAACTLGAELPQINERSLQSTTECHLNRDERLFGSVLLTFSGRPDLIQESERTTIEQTIISSYNDAVGCSSPGLRTVTSAQTTTNFGDFARVRSEREFSIEVRLEGTCRDCVMRPTLLFDSNATACGCQGPTRQELSVEFGFILENLISARQLPSIRDFNGLVELSNLVCPTNFNEFSVSVVVSFEGNLAGLSTNDFNTLGSAFGDSYNLLNGLNPNTCDRFFRSVIGVSVSIEQDFYTADENSEDENEDYFFLRFDLRMQCRNCDTTDIRAFSLASEDESFDDELENEVFDRVRLLQVQHITKAEDHRTLQVSECRCARSAAFRAVSEEEMSGYFEEVVSGLGIASIVAADDVIEIEQIDCPTAVDTFETQVTLDFQSTTEEVSNATIRRLERDFLRSYNNLASRFCDPFFREITNATISGASPVRRLKENKRLGRSLQFQYSFFYTVGGVCRGCNTDTGIFDDGFRRRLSRNDRVPERAKGRRINRFLQSNLCYCSSINVNPGAPTEREFFQRYDTDVQADANLQGVGRVTALASDQVSMQAQPQECSIATDCNRPRRGDLCVFGRCIFEGNPRFTLTWTGDDDYDLAVTPPEGSTISGENQYDQVSDGSFDTGFSQSGNGSFVESISFPRDGSAFGGIYNVSITQFAQRGGANDFWTLQIFGERGELEETFTGDGDGDVIMYDHRDGALADEEVTCPTPDEQGSVECCENMDCPTMEQECVNFQCIERGNPRFTLSWFGDDELSIFVRTPDGEIISREEPNDPQSGGIYEEDIRQGEAGAVHHTQNIHFPRDGSSPDGSYIYFVEIDDQIGVADDWRVEVFYNGESTDTFGSRESPFLSFLKVPPVFLGGRCEVDGRQVQCCSDSDCPGSDVCTVNRCVVEGTPRFTLSWLGDDDLDIYVIRPDGVRIDYQNPQDSADEGMLQDDADPASDIAHVEAVHFQRDGRSPTGTYLFGADLFDQRGPTLDKWNLTVHVFGEEVMLFQGQGTSSTYDFFYDGGATSNPPPPPPPPPEEPNHSSNPQIAPLPLPSPPPPPPPPIATMAPAPSPLVFCFSGNSLVRVEGQGYVEMRLLKVGDRVMVGPENNNFERIYSFGHKDEAQVARFLRFLPFELELSHDHLVFVKRRGAIPASMVVVGDELSNGEAVTAIQVVSRTGVYAPFTPSGTLVVNGVVASNYVAFQGSDTLKIGSTKTPLSFHTLNHQFQAAHRIWCHWLDMPDRLDSSNGMSTMLNTPLQIALWALDLPPIQLAFLFLPFGCLLCVLAFLEFVLRHCVAISVGIGLLYAYKSVIRQWRLGK